MNERIEIEELENDSVTFTEEEFVLMLESGEVIPFTHD